jgi:hypothetical protein
MLHQPTDLLIADSDDLRKALLDVALDEGAHLFDRRRLETGNKSAFPGHHIDGGMETLDVFFPDRANLDRHRPTPNLLRIAIPDATRPCGLG